MSCDCVMFFLHFLDNTYTVGNPVHDKLCSNSKYFVCCVVCHVVSKQAENPLYKAATVKVVNPVFFGSPDADTKPAESN